MIQNLGELLGGLGLFFVGMWLLTDNLKALTTRRVRRIAVSWAPNRYAAWGWGVLCGIIVQSMSAMTFIAISMSRANIVSENRIFAFVLGGNLGLSLLVILVSLDIQVAAFFVLGVASVLFVTERAVRFRNVGGALFGLAMLFVGLGLIKESAASLAGQGVFDAFLEVAGKSLWITFLGAALLSFIVQTSAAVVVFVVGMSAIGILTADQTIMAVYGSYVGTNLTLSALSFKQTGEARRIAMSQVFYNVVVIAVFVPLLYIELWFDIPLIKTLVLVVPLEPSLSTLGLLSDLLLALPVILVIPLAVRLFSRLWPATSTEAMSRLAFIHDRAHGDVATALQLVSLEQRRLLSAFSLYLHAVRQGDGIEPLRSAVRTIIGEIDEFLIEMRVRHSGHSVEDVNSVLTCQRLIIWLEEQFAELCDTLSQLPGGESGERLRGVMVEGIDVVVLTIIECLNSDNPEDWETAKQLTDDRYEVLQQLRSSYMTLDDSPDLSGAFQAKILETTNTAREIFFLLSRFLREMESSPIPTSPAGIDP